MSNNNLPAKAYDIYLSYAIELELKVLRLYNILVDRYELKVWLDSVEIRQGDDRFQKTTEAISKSKIMLCCVNKMYPSASKCKSDITLGYTNDKNILLLMFENLSAQEIQPLQFAIGQNTQRFNLYEITKESHLFHGEVFNAVLQAIESLTERKLFNRKTRKSLKHHNDEMTIIKPDKRVSFPSVAISTAVHAVENSIRVTTITTEEVVVERGTLLYREYEEEQQEYLNLNFNRLNIRKFRSTSLITSVCGFNRMVFLEGKGKYLITSSYNQSIVIADKNGNWLERRNLCGVLREPYSICASKTEVFIGDNEAKCIFVFDYHLQLLRKIAVNVCDGFFDLAHDEQTNEIFIADLFNSRLYVVDGLNGRLRRTAFIPSPTYIRLFKDQLFILSTDYIYCLKKLTFDIEQTIKLPNSDCIFGLYVDNRGFIYTTAHDVDENDHKSRDVFIYVIRSLDRHIIRKYPMPLTQVNDMVINGGKMLFLSDTHIDIFDYGGM